MRARRLGHEEHPEDIGLEGALQLMLADVDDIGGGMLFAGIVDEDVELAEPLDHLGDRIVAKILVADIAWKRDRLAALGTHDPGGLFGIVMFFEIDDCDMRALARIQRRDRAADPAVRPGDDRHLARQPPRSGKPRGPFGLWLEPAFVPGKRGVVQHLDRVAHRKISSPHTTPVPPSRFRAETMASAPLALRRGGAGSFRSVGNRHHGVFGLR